MFYYLPSANEVKGARLIIKPANVKHHICFLTMKFLVALTIVLLVSTALGNIKKDTLKAHKKYRKLHGVKKLKWDNNVAEFAEKHCKYLADNNKFEHSKNSGYGENLYKAGGSGSADKAGQKATKMWYDEIKLYNYNNPGFSMQTGHFTQVDRSLIS